jgi:hypothetical protein
VRLRLLSLSTINALQRLIAYLAHHNGNTGTLFISPTGLRFAPFLSGKNQDKSKDSTASIPSSNPDKNAVPGPGAAKQGHGVIVDGKEVRIPMDEISGLGKIQKSRLGVTISSGLEVETVSAGVSVCAYRVSHPVHR